MKSKQELYQEFIDELQSNAPELTDLNEGSDIDVIGQATTSAVNELTVLALQKFRKTFFDTAQGDDLQTLAVDHFGTSFERPKATYAKGVVTFSRANNTAGNVEIPVGTIVKSKKTSAGNAQSFKTDLAVTLTGTTINASVTALESGIGSNVVSNTVVEIESSLSDSSVVVTNANPMSGGAEAQTDAEYRLTIKRLIEALKGATLKAIESRALTVSGVIYAKAIEKLVTVVEYDEILAVVTSTPFKLPRTRLYVSDANGSASTTLLNQVRDSISFVRAAGVNVELVAAAPVVIDWTGQLTLNPLGPNYATLQSDLTKIKNAMKDYIIGLAIGSSFIRKTADAYILSKFGPAGTNDISSFFSLVPTADVAATPTQKFLAGNMVL